VICEVDMIYIVYFW